MFSAQTHRTIYLVLLALLGATMVTSVWAANLVWVLLGVNWLIEGRWQEKWRMARASRLLQAFAVFYLIHIVGLLWTSHLDEGLRVLQVKLPLLVVPLVMLTTPHAQRRPRNAILSVYVLTVLVVSIIGAVRLLTIDNLPYRDAVPYISHIRFALNCCIAICLLAASCHTHRPLPTLVRLLAAAWLLCFLLMLRSYTALAVLLAVSLLAAAAQRKRWLWLGLWLLVVGGLSACIASEVRAYYRLSPLATAPLAEHTAGGRPYSHGSDGIIENGNYISRYICTEELRNEWARRSTVDYDSVGDDGFALHPRLVRYLNALGLTKDSVGVWALSDSQVKEIEQGVANPVYSSHNPVRKMVYVMLYEYENHRHSQSVKGFTMLQRLELWRATLHVVRQKPWLGTGTGDATADLHAELHRTGSPLAEGEKRSHNQYLSLLLSFGAVGFILILTAFGRAWIASHRRLGLVALAWVLTIAISCLTEDTLDTLAGQLLCTYFLAFIPRE